MDYLTTAEVARRYRTADATVRYWRMTGYGPKGVKVGRRVLYPMAEIERFDRELSQQASEDLLLQRPQARTRLQPDVDRSASA